MSERPANTGDGSWAVTLVHGIGYAEQGSFLKIVASALRTQRPGLEFDKSTEIRDRGVPDRPGADAELQFMRKGAIGKTPVRLATAHWSDISNVPDSLFSLLGSMMMGGLGVRHFADVCTHGNTAIGRILHFVLTAMILLLGVVYLPLTLASLFFGLSGIIAFYLIGMDGGTLFDRPIWTYQIPVIACLSILMSAIVGAIGISRFWQRRKVRTLSIPIFCILLVVSAGAAALLVLGHPRWGNIAEIPKTIIALMTGYGNLAGNYYLVERVGSLDQIGIYFAFLQTLQQFCGLAVIVLTALVLALLLLNAIVSRNRPHNRSLLFGAVCVISMWALILLVLWPENLVTTAAMNLYEETGKSVLVRELPYYFNFLKLQFDQVAPNTKMISLFPLLWFEAAYFGLLLALVAVFVIVASYRAAWTALYRNADLDRLADRIHSSVFFTALRPRLILSALFKLAIIAFMISITAIAAAQAFNFDEWVVEDLLGFSLGATKRVPHEIAAYTATVAIIVIVVVFIFVAIAHRIRAAVKLALDVVNHLAAPGQSFPIRRQIAQRLRDTIALQLEEARRPHLVVIAHSQGTVITLDTLFGYRDHTDTWHDGMWDAGLRDKVSSLTVLTFGSPITHIYQHYFSRLYPPFKDVEAFQRASKDDKVTWINCYRLDDYIGAWVDGTLPHFPDNIPMAVGGHVNYWSDDVFERLFKHPRMQKVLVDTSAPATTMPAEVQALPATA